MKKNGLKKKNIFLIGVLAVAGLFGVSAAAIDKQVNEEPVVEKAEANNVASTRYYVKLNYSSCQAWENDNAWFGVYLFTSGSGSDPSTWVKAYPFGDHTFAFDTPSGTTYPNWAFVRLNPSSTEMSWSNKWGDGNYGQTTDLGWSEGKDFFLVGDSNSKPAGEWSNIYYSSNQIQEHIIDNALSTAADGSKNFVMRVYSVTYHSNFAYSSMTIKQLHDSHSDIFWDSMTFVNDGDGAIDVTGIFDWHYEKTTPYRSYKFSLPWWIAGCKYKIHIDSTGAWCNTEVTTAAQKYERRWFNQGGEWYISGYTSDTMTYNEPIYSVIYDSNGGSTQNSVLLRKHEKVTKPSPNPTKSGYLLQQWNDSSSATYTFGSAITSNIKLTAQWRSVSGAYIFWDDENKHNIYAWNNADNSKKNANWPGETIECETIGGSETMHFKELNLTGDASVDWVIFNDGSEQSNDLSLDANTRNLNGKPSQYWHWDGSKWCAEDFSIVITYKDEGDEIYSGSTIADSDKEFDFQEDFELPEVTKSHYTFDGWYSNSACTGEPISHIDAYTQHKDLTVYAKWTADSFHIEFNMNSEDVKGAMSPIEAEYDSDCVLSANTYTFDGHNFDGWATASDGSVVYSNSATISASAINLLLENKTVDVDGTYVLYAHWTSGESAAITYAQAFNSTVGGVCDSYDSNTKADFITVWNTSGTSSKMEYNYSQLADYVKYWLTTSPSSDDDVVEMLGKYDYVLSKYGYGSGDGNLHDFLSRSPAQKGAINGLSGLSLFSDEDSTSAIIIIIASSVALLSVTALSILVLKKRRREQE